MAVYLRNVPASVRRFATHTITKKSVQTPVITSGSSVEAINGPLRPHLNIPVNPNHGLYGFFRRRTVDNSHLKATPDGPPEYVAVEVPPTLSGRAWDVAELRRKSFKDLHVLWYILLRERNLLATQKQELKRNQIIEQLFDKINKKSAICRQSMARIKLVINERRFAYMDAIRVRRALKKEQRQIALDSGSGSTTIATGDGARKNKSDVEPDVSGAPNT